MEYGNLLQFIALVLCQYLDLGTRLEQRYKNYSFIVFAVNVIWKFRIWWNIKKKKLYKNHDANPFCSSEFLSSFMQIFFFKILNQILLGSIQSVKEFFFFNFFFNFANFSKFMFYFFPFLLFWFVIFRILLLTLILKKNHSCMFILFFLFFFFSFNFSDE